MGVWIEMLNEYIKAERTNVTPFVGVWIEIIMKLDTAEAVVSLPSWECGLKWNGDTRISLEVLVTPFVGVWIEISMGTTSDAALKVTPFVGVWIEIKSRWRGR